MRAQEARELGERVAQFVQAGEMAQAYDLLSPVLAERTPFRLLGYIGQAVGTRPLAGVGPEHSRTVNAFLEHIAVAKTEGGWVVIGSALGAQLGHDLAGALARCRDFIVAGNVWYAADILAERVPGPGLVDNFEPSLALLAPWREDADRWVRRAVGVSVHFWAQRSRGAAEQVPRAEALLTFLESMFEEWDMDAVKGVGWGLKTLGKRFPELVADWLAQQVVPSQRRHRALMLRKAVTYLSHEQRARVAGADRRVW